MVDKNSLHSVREIQSLFAARLLDWYDPEDRPMPWKHVSDPYKVWVSEIMLQQTRVEQATAYFNRFMAAFPTIQALAKAPLDRVLSKWEGLGYYSRARNMHKAAQVIIHDLNGKFPSTYTEIIKLPGIGPYTAAAISSFVFGETRAVLDGNVMRILARIFGLRASIDSTQTKNALQQLANELISEQEPGRFNQAIMDHGATVCLPAQPLCSDCCFNSFCTAYAEATISQIPVRKVKPAKKHRFFHYVLVKRGQFVLVKQRKSTDIWKNLFEFPLIEKQAAGRLTMSEVRALLPGCKIDEMQLMETGKQTLSHQIIHGAFYTVTLSDKDEIEGLWLSLKDLDDHAFPRMIRRFIERHPNIE